LKLKHRQVYFVQVLKLLQIAIVALLAASSSTLAQRQESLLQRWVGTTHEGRPLFLDFYADTMLVVNDRYIADFEMRGDTLIAVGDTSFTVHYRFAPMDRLLLRTEDGHILTMSRQGPLARPLWGNWLGRPIRSPDRILELRMTPSGVAYWRWLAQGTWTEGEWDRFHRRISFTWLPDSTVWEGLYDPAAGQLLFDETEPESGVTILRRFFRRRSY
jgi:hypothetical protein